MATQIYQSKLETEHIDASIDMLSRLAVGETVVTAAAAMSVFSGNDPSPSSMLSGLPSISGTTVTQKVIGGLPGVIYLLALSVRTSLNNILINEVKIAVLSDNAIVPPP